MSGAWHADRSGIADLTSAQLRALAGPGAEVTVMGVPVGSGTRMGLDRDRDGFPDGDELAWGSDPADPASKPVTTGVPPLGGRAPTGLRGALPNPFHDVTALEFTLARPERISLTIYDVMGREASVLAHDQAFPAGVHRLDWNGRREGGAPLGAGLYFARLRIAGRTWTTTVVKLDR